MTKGAWLEVFVKSLNFLSSWTILLLGLIIAILGYFAWREPKHKKVAFWSMVAGIFTAFCSIVSHLCDSTISDWDKASLDGAIATIQEQSNKLATAETEISQLRYRTGQRRIKDGTKAVLAFIDAVQNNGLIHSATWSNGVRQWPDGREKRIDITFSLGDHEAAVFAWDLRFVLQQYFEVPENISNYLGGNDGITIFFDGAKQPMPEALALGKALRQLGYSLKLHPVSSNFFHSKDEGSKPGFILHVGPKVDTDPVDTAKATKGN